MDKTNQASAATSAPRHFASLFPPAKHLAYAADMLRLREQRAAERSARQEARTAANDNGRSRVRSGSGR